MKKRFSIILIILLGYWILVACGSSTEEPTTLPVNSPSATETLPANIEVTSDVPYPYPVYNTPIPPPYPIPTVESYVNSAYPIVEPTSGPVEVDINLVPFQISKPVYEGDTLIKGTGPVGVPILLVNVTYLGTPLGEATIDPEGNFEIEVEPLKRGNRLGITVGDLSGTAWTEATFQRPEFNGDEAQAVPLVGFLYDTVLVSEK